jgi:hypothetical protein
MAQRSTIDRLPEDQQQQINALCADKRKTLDQLVEELQKVQLDEPVSRSALGRHRLKIEEVAQAMRESRDMAKMLRAEMGDLADDEQSQINYEMLQGQIFKAQRAMLVGDVEPENMIKELRQLSDALQRLSAARKLDTDRIMRIKQEAAKATAQKAATVVEKALRTDAPGLSADTVKSIMTQVLGVAT